MDRELNLKAYVGLMTMPVIMGAPLFLSAGTLDYWEGWVFLAVFSVATTLHGLYVMKHDPALLERRMRVGPSAEKRPAQRIIMWGVTVSFILLLIVAGIDHRLWWFQLPAGGRFCRGLFVMLCLLLFLLR